MLCTVTHVLKAFHFSEITQKIMPVTSPKRLPTNPQTIPKRPEMAPTRPSNHPCLKDFGAMRNTREQQQSVVNNAAYSCNQRTRCTVGMTRAIRSGCNPWVRHDTWLASLWHPIFTPHIHVFVMCATVNPIGGTWLRGACNQGTVTG